jgi:hypothetical protein
MKKQTVLMTTSVVALALLLVGAAFVGGRLLADRQMATDNQQIEVSRPGSGETVSGLGVKIETVYADEMPKRAPDVAGLFARREDDSLFVGTGALSGVKVDDRWELSHDGPVFEVVATHDTLLYRDDTRQQFGDDPPSDPVQQVLTPCTVDEIAENSTISAWGEWHGERLVAAVIVFFPNG